MNYCCSNDMCSQKWPCKILINKLTHIPVRWDWNWQCFLIVPTKEGMMRVYVETAAVVSLHIAIVAINRCHSEGLCLIDKFIKERS